MHSKYNVVWVVLISFIAGCSTYYTRVYWGKGHEKNKEPYIEYYEQISENTTGWKVRISVISTINNPNQVEAFADSFSVGISFQALSDESPSICYVDVLEAQIKIPNADKSIQLSVDRIITSDTIKTKYPLRWYDIDFNKVYLSSMAKEINLILVLDINYENDSILQKEWSIDLFRHEDAKKGIPPGLFH